MYLFIDGRNSLPEYSYYDTLKEAFDAVEGDSSWQKEDDFEWRTENGDFSIFKIEKM